MDRPHSNPLAMPVGALMRPAAYVAPEDSLALAGARLHESGVGAVGVVEGHVLVGSLDESTFAGAIAGAVDLSEACSSFTKDTVTVRPYESAAQALRVIDDNSLTSLFVVDEQNRLMGVLTPTDLLPRKRAMIRPPMVGGMATPFGVYLTTGTVHGGAPWYGLVATGMLLFTLLLAAQTLGFYLAGFVVGTGIPIWLAQQIAAGLSIALFFLGMRLMPLSGTHAAEHQVVHAIERGEDLLPQIVKRMPRVHPRCGTNLAVGLSIFLGISSVTFIPDDELKLLLALIVTAATWRPLGSLLQYYVTTRPANERQLQSGIKAGNELLERYQSTRVASPSIPLRIWNSGVLHVIGGSMIMYALVQGLALLFGWQIEV